MRARNDDDRTGPNGMLSKEENAELKDMAAEEEWEEGWDH